MTGYHETNFSMAYSSHISWQTSGLAGAHGSLSVAGLRQPVRKPRQPAQHEHSRPRAGRRRKPRAGRSARNDKAKLDEYLTSVREVEKRVDGMRKNKDKADDLAKQRNKPVFTMDRPANGLPEDFREHTRLMCDIIAIAFQTDKTRVATLLLGPRPFGALLSVPRRPRRPPRGVAQQLVRRLRAHRALPSEPVRLPGGQARQHAGRRRHGARQLLPDVPLEHVDRPQARQHAGCRWCWPAGWAARWRPAAR